jgi:hypothetical protein
MFMPNISLDVSFTNISANQWGTGFRKEDVVKNNRIRKGEGYGIEFRLFSFFIFPII